MKSSKTFYIISFDSTDTGRTEISRTFASIRTARKQAASYAKYAGNVKIYKGGPGGVVVS